MENEIRIPIPEGMEIDRENSTFDCIKFKPIEKKRWRDNTDAIVKGYYISPNSHICGQLCVGNIEKNYGLFATEKQAKSALAMARISQIMANDERFGGVVIDEEWKSGKVHKFVIMRSGNCIQVNTNWLEYHFLAFHTLEQRALFLEENEDLIRDYLMFD